MTCKLSIIIPTFNSENTIRETLNSIRQIWPLLDKTEIILIDGKSKDSTLSIVTQSNLPIQIHSEKDNGIYDAMNKGVALASGDWVYFLGSDDVLLPEFVDAASSLENRYNSYYCQVSLTQDDSVYCGEFNTPKILLKNICHQSIFYSKTSLHANPFEEQYLFLADYVFNLKIWARTNRHFLYRPYVICRYNNLTGSSSKTIDRAFARTKKKLILKEFGVFIFLYYVVLATIIKTLLLFPFFRKYWKTV